MPTRVIADALATPAEAICGIDDVQVNSSNLLGQNVTVVGQVFLRASSAGTGAPSAYIEDGTGRGINVLGALGSPVRPALDSLGTVAKVTGTVAQSFTTIQLTSFTATSIAVGMPDLAPQALTGAQASSPQWAGTYIQSAVALTAPYATAYQVVPRALSDITFLDPRTAAGDPGDVGAQLYPTRPNPFSRSAEIRYKIPGSSRHQGAHVRLLLLDLQGRVVATLVDRFDRPGDHVVSVKPESMRRLGSGIHSYRLEVDGRIFTQKAIYLR